MPASQAPPHCFPQRASHWHCSSSLARLGQRRDVHELRCGQMEGGVSMHLHSVHCCRTRVHAAPRGPPAQAPTE